MIMSVTLRKSSDYAPAPSPFHAPGWQATVRLAVHLLVSVGDDVEETLYEGLANNEPTALRDTFRGPGYVNLPTLPKGAGHSLSPTGDTPDYSDGHGGTYTPGE
jgi:hypothetical protein